MARKSESNWVRIFEVTNPTRHNKFTVYKVTSKVFPKSCPEGATVISVWKRYNDFKKLYKELSAIHKQLHLTGEFPKFPKATIFGRYDYEIVEERRKAAWTLLEFSANHSQLFTHKTFVSFFEHGYKIKENSSTQNLNRIDGSTNGSCLIPEKLWSDADALSISSVESGSTHTATYTTDSDSVVSNSVLSDTPANNLLPHSPFAAVDIGSLPHSAFNVSSKNSSIRSEFDSGLHSDHTQKGEDSLMGDSYTEAETRSHSSFSVVSSSKSCPALDEISSTSTCSSSQQQHQQEQAAQKTLPRSLKRSWGLSMKRNSNGLSGFFDFLPIFPKKVEEKKRSDEKLLTNSLSASYICEAAGHFAVAQQFESNGELAKALDSYKEGIKLLLHGGQNDKDTKRRIIVKSKIEKYLSKAEALHFSLHCDEKSTGHPSETSALFSPKKVQGLLTLKSSSLDGSNVNSTDSMKSSDLEDLRNYKVVGVAASGVLLVVDVAKKHQPKCYAIKVLRKSASPMMPNKTTIIASQVPFMVKLIKWFDTENTVILLLQYAGGGKLEDFVYNYQTKQISIIPHEAPCDNEIDKVDGMEFIDDHSSNERKNAMAVLGAFAEQMETKRRLDLNGNLGCNEQEELCDSYARLFQESDSEDSSKEAQNDDNDVLKKEIGDQMKNGNTEVENNLQKKKEEEPGDSRKRRGKSKKECLGSAAEMGGKLAVDSSLGSVDFDDINETLEIEPVSSTIPTITTRIKATASRGRIMKVKASKAFPPPDVVENDSVISWSNLDAVDTSDLIENSKVLLQTVSRTLTQCDIAASAVVVDGGISTDRELKSESKEPSREQNNKKKNGRPTPPGASSSSSREYGDYNNGSGTDGVSVSNRTMSFLESPNSSLSLSAGKQKPVETNETENNNNKGWSQNGGSLMSGESKSQCSKLGVNEKSTVSQTTREDGEENKGWVRTDCSDVSNDRSETSTDELLVGEISDATKLGPQGGEGEEGSAIASSHCQSTHNGDSNEPLPIQRMVPECCVKVWIAEIVLALEKLHSAGLTYGDLGMRNILLGENGHILLSFISQWSDVDYDYVPPPDEWVAPEARINFGNSFPCSRANFHFSVDFWSLGTILFYLLTGRTVQSCHPEGSHANTSLKILDTNLCGEYISAHAKSLMTELLQMNPMLRLGYYGAEEIKTHPFFDGFDWDKALEEWGKNV